MPALLGREFNLVTVVELHALFDLGDRVVDQLQCFQAMAALVMRSGI